jgi:hypothetical protein
MNGPQSTKKTTETKEVKPSDFVSVKLLRNYRPASTDFKVLQQDQETEVWTERSPEGAQEKLDEDGKIKEVAVGELHKVWAGACLSLPREEAKRAIGLRIAERHNDL